MSLIRTEPFFLEDVSISRKDIRTKNKYGRYSICLVLDSEEAKKFVRILEEDFKTAYPKSKDDEYRNYRHLEVGNRILEAKPNLLYLKDKYTRWAVSSYACTVKDEDEKPVQDLPRFMIGDAELYFSFNPMKKKVSLILKSFIYKREENRQFPWSKQEESDNIIPFRRTA